MVTTFSFAQDPPVKAQPPQPEITFVASYEEFKAADNAKDQLKGLAISNGFYRSVDETVRTRIEELVKSVLKKFYRPVFFYGSSLDIPRITDVFGLGEPTCKPIELFGVFPTFVIDGRMSAGNVWICDHKYSEMELRDFITEAWIQYKKELAQEGFGT